VDRKTSWLAVTGLGARPAVEDKWIKWVTRIEVSADQSFRALLENHAMMRVLKKLKMIS